MPSVRPLASRTQQEIFRREEKGCPKNAKQNKKVKKPKMNEHESLRICFNLHLLILEAQEKLTDVKR